MSLSRDRTSLGPSSVFGIFGDVISWRSLEALYNRFEWARDVVIESLLHARKSVVKSDVVKTVFIMYQLIVELQSRFGPYDTMAFFSMRSDKAVRALIAYAICQKVARVRHHFNEEFIHRELLVHQSPQDKELISEIKHYARFTTGSYGPMMQRFMKMHRVKIPGKVNRAVTYLSKLPQVVNMTNYQDYQSLIHYAKVDAKDVLHIGESSDFFNPLHYVIADHHNKSIVLLVRGTATIHDLMTDLCCKSVDFYAGGIRGYVHEGMLKSAQRLETSLRDIVQKSLAMYPTYRLRLVGHSLGAGVASILTLLWSNEFPDLHCFAFGCPCVLSHDLSTFAKRYVTSVVRGYDFVSRLSLESVLDLFKAVSHFALNPGLSEAIIFGSIGSQSWLGIRDPNSFVQQCESTLRQCRKRISTDRLVPVGKVLWITTESFSQVEDENKLSGPTPVRPILHIWEVDSILFREIVFAKNMFMHHIPYIYEKALGTLDKELLEDTPTPSPRL